MFFVLLWLSHWHFGRVRSSQSNNKLGGIERDLVLTFPKCSWHPAWEIKEVRLVKIHLIMTKLTHWLTNIHMFSFGVEVRRIPPMLFLANRYHIFLFFCTFLWTQAGDTQGLAGDISLSSSALFPLSLKVTRVSPFFLLLSLSNPTFICPQIFSFHSLWLPLPGKLWSSCAMSATRLGPATCNRTCKDWWIAFPSHMVSFSPANSCILNFPSFLLPSYQPAYLLPHFQLCRLFIYFTCICPCSTMGNQNSWHHSLLLWFILTTTLLGRPKLNNWPKVI